MSVLLETTLGDIVVDLFVDDAPKASQNFLKLCKAKHYNNKLFTKIEKDFLAFCGEPEKDNFSAWHLLLGNKKKVAAGSDRDVTGADAEQMKRDTADGGDDAGEQMKKDGNRTAAEPEAGTSVSRARFFEDEIVEHLKHDQVGILGMATEQPNSNGSRFYVTLRDEIPTLDGAHTIFGKVAEEEGLAILREQLNVVLTDHFKKPFQNVRIKHTVVLDDPFEDIADEETGYESPAEVLDKTAHAIVEEDEGAQLERIAAADAKSQAITLELLNDLPDADIKPPDNVLFLANLNPVTQDSDLQLLFERFGLIRSCEIIRDFKTGDSLQYAFIEYEAERDCEEAFFKMQGVLVDGRRIHVDFSQSVAKSFSAFKSGRIGIDEVMKMGEGSGAGGGKGKGKGGMEDWGGKSTKFGKKGAALFNRSGGGEQQQSAAAGSFGSGYGNYGGKGSKGAFDKSGATNPNFIDVAPYNYQKGGAGKKQSLEVPRDGRDRDQNSRSKDRRKSRSRSRSRHRDRKKRSRSRDRKRHR